MQHLGARLRRARCRLYEEGSRRTSRPVGDEAYAQKLLRANTFDSLVRRLESQAGRRNSGTHKASCVFAAVMRTQFPILFFQAEIIARKIARIVA